jgi:homoserine dehydrogenase
VADIIDVIRWKNQPIEDRVPSLGFASNQLQSAPVVSIDSIETSYYLRCFAQDHAGVLAKITSILADSNISIEHLHQEPCAQNEGAATLVMITNTVKESLLNTAIASLSQLEDIEGDIMRIRIESLGS